MKKDRFWLSVTEVSIHGHLAMLLLGLCWGRASWWGCRGAKHLPSRAPESKDIQEGKGCISKGTSLPVTRRHFLKVPPGVMTKSLAGGPQARGHAKGTEMENITAQQLGKLYKINLLVMILLDYILKLPLIEFFFFVWKNNCRNSTVRASQVRGEPVFPGRTDIAMICFQRLKKPCNPESVFLG